MTRTIHTTSTSISQAASSALRSVFTKEGAEQSHENNHERGHEKNHITSKLGNGPQGKHIDVLILLLKVRSHLSW